MADPEDCPGCGHLLSKEVHDPRDGCLEGWDWGPDGIFTKEGCNCPLTVAGQTR